jgi:hypothetical protein
MPARAEVEEQQQQRDQLVIQHVLPWQHNTNTEDTHGLFDALLSAAFDENIRGIILPLRPPL